MNRDSNRTFGSFFPFLWKYNLIWSFESIDFLIFLPNIPSLFDCRYGCKGTNDVKKGTYFRKLNFGEKVSTLPPSNHFPLGYVVLFSSFFLKYKTWYRSTRSQVFFKISVLKISQYSHLSWSLFFIKLKAFMLVALLKRDSNTCVFQWILRTLLLKSTGEYYKIFKDTFLQKTSPGCV